MKRAIAGVIAGYLVWTVLWLGGNAIFFSAATEVMGAGKPFTEIGPLIGIIILSVVCSIAAGITASSISKRAALGTVLVLAALLLATGLVVQIGVWAFMPLWHHVTFLVLIAPMTVLGAKLRH